MRVLHVCLAAFYIDDFGYQENILPRIHREQGHEVAIVASTETYLDRVRLGYTDPGRYLSSDGIPVTRLPYVAWLPSRLARKLRLYRGLRAQIEAFVPDVIFLHDCQFLDIGTVARHARRHGTAVFVDCHTDFVNSGRNWLSRSVLHGWLYRACARRIAPVTRRFFATLPLRAEFLEQVYGIDPKQIELLPFGADDSRIDRARRPAVRAQVRHALSIDDRTVVFATGGKIDRRKDIHTLIDAFIDRSDAGALGNAVLLVFGRAEPALEGALARAAGHPRIRCVGWVAAPDVHRYLWASDVAVFPGTHSVLWEEAVGLGVPCVFRRWHGIEHVDVGGNCLLLNRIDRESLGTTLTTLASDAMLRERLCQAAATRGARAFSYTSIARRALGQGQEAGHESPGQGSG